MDSDDNVYKKAINIKKHIEKNKLKDVNAFLCLASLEWQCGKITEFDEDIIDFGNDALNWLNKALGLDSSNEKIKKVILSVEKAISKSKKRYEKEIKYIQEAEKQSIETLKNDPYLSEVAFFYYSRCEKSIENAKKGFTYYSYLYEREYNKNNNGESLLYYWHALTHCKLQYQTINETKNELDKLKFWNQSTGQHVYNDLISNGFWYELSYFADKNNLNEFTNLFNQWVKKMDEIAPNNEFLSYPSELFIPVCNWLLTKKDIDEILNKICSKIQYDYLPDDQEIMIDRIKDKINSTE